MMATMAGMILNGISSCIPDGVEKEILRIAHQECHMEVINKMHDSGLNIQVVGGKNHHGRH